MNTMSHKGYAARIEFRRHGFLSGCHDETSD